MSNLHCTSICQLFLNFWRNYLIVSKAFWLTDLQTFSFRRLYHSSILRKSPLFNEFEDSSFPLKDKPCFNRKRVTSKTNVKRMRYATSIMWMCIQLVWLALPPILEALKLYSCIIMRTIHALACSMNFSNVVFPIIEPHCGEYIFSYSASSTWLEKIMPKTKRRILRHAILQTWVLFKASILKTPFYLPYSFHGKL